MGGCWGRERGSLNFGWVLQKGVVSTGGAGRGELVLWRAAQGLVRPQGCRQV